MSYLTFARNRFFFTKLFKNGVKTNWWLCMIFAQGVKRQFSAASCASKMFCNFCMRIILVEVVIAGGGNVWDKFFRSQAIHVDGLNELLRRRTRIIIRCAIEVFSLLDKLLNSAFSENFVNYNLKKVLESCRLARLATARSLVLIVFILARASKTEASEEMQLLSPLFCHDYYLLSAAARSRRYTLSKCSRNSR